MDNQSLAKVPLIFDEVKQDVDNALISVSNKLEREWPPGVGTDDSQAIVVGLFRVSFTSFLSIRYLCATQPPDPVRKPEFVTATPPVLRSMLDALANIVFLFEDIGHRTTEFMRRGWKEDYDREERYRKLYGSDPRWATTLSEMAAERGRLQDVLGIQQSEATKLRRWPGLGTMISKEVKTADRIRDTIRFDFLTYLNDLIYREFSEDAHLSPPGLYKRSEVLLVDPKLWTRELHAQIQRMRSDALIVSLVLLMGMASEIQNELRFGMGERLVQLWTRLCHHSQLFEEIYGFRYRILISGQP